MDTTGDDGLGGDNRNGKQRVQLLWGRYFSVMWRYFSVMSWLPQIRENVGSCSRGSPTPGSGILGEDRRGEKHCIGGVENPRR